MRFNRFHGKLCCSVGPAMDLVRAPEAKARSRSGLYDISRQRRTIYELSRYTNIPSTEPCPEKADEMQLLVGFPCFSEVLCISTVTHVTGTHADKGYGA